MYLFKRLNVGLSRLGFEHPTFNMRGDRSNRLHHQHGFFIPIWAMHFEKENNIDAARRKMVMVNYLVVYLSTSLF